MPSPSTSPDGVWRNGYASHREATRGNCSPEYTAWQAMKRRCYSPSQHAYHRYGGRGIIVCDRWLNGDGHVGGFECFLADMGRKPTPKHSLDRIDRNGNYAPANCRWVTQKEQMRNISRNRVVTFDGFTGPLVEVCERHGAPYALVLDRLSKGWTIDRAMLAPKHRPGVRSCGWRDGQPVCVERGKERTDDARH